MGPMSIACIVLACVFGGALLGVVLRPILPAHHLSADSKDVIKLAMGLTATMAALVLALLIASAARTEVQVALYGALTVFILALIGGCVLPREMMPESTQFLSYFTPHGWALDAYRELLDVDPTSVPDLGIVWQSCGVLTAFGAGFLALAWGLLRLD